VRNKRARVRPCRTLPGQHMRRQVLIPITGRWHGTINRYAVASIAEIKFVTRKEQDRAFPPRLLVVSIWAATSALDHDIAQAASIRNRRFVCARLRPARISRRCFPIAHPMLFGHSNFRYWLGDHLMIAYLDISLHHSPRWTRRHTDDPSASGHQSLRT
jgi:hypothetical protein